MTMGEQQLGEQQLGEQQQEWIRRIEAALVRAERLCALDDVILNARPAPNEWSIGQHLDHAALGTAAIGGKVSAALNAAPAARSAAGASKLWSPGFVESQFLKALGPQGKGRTPVPRIFLPTDEPLHGPELLAHFQQVHHTFIERIRATNPSQLTTVKAPSAVTPLLRLRLGAWYEGVAIHTDYHISRAEDVSAVSRGKELFPAIND